MEAPQAPEQAVALNSHDLSPPLVSSPTPVGAAEVAAVTAAVAEDQKEQKEQGGVPTSTGAGAGAGAASAVGVGGGLALKKGRGKTHKPVYTWRNKQDYLKAVDLKSVKAVGDALQHTPYMFLLVYMETCPHCKAFNPTLAQLAALFHGAIAKGDAPTHDQVAVARVEGTKITAGLKDLFGMPADARFTFPRIFFKRPQCATGVPNSECREMTLYQYGHPAEQISPETYAFTYPGVKMETLGDGRIMLTDVDGTQMAVVVDPATGKFPNPEVIHEQDRSLPSLMYSMARVYGNPDLVPLNVDLEALTAGNTDPDFYLFYTPVPTLPATYTRVRPTDFAQQREDVNKKVVDEFSMHPELLQRFNVKAIDIERRDQGGISSPTFYAVARDSGHPEGTAPQGQIFKEQDSLYLLNLLVNGLPSEDE